MPATADSGHFPLGEARKLVRDLLTPKPFIYWADFLSNMTIGWGSFVLALMAPVFSIWQVFFYLISVLALYRAVIFIHELAHLKKRTFTVFRAVWNVTCGFPLMVPSFTYHGVHNDHHKRDIYGTKDDGEYLPFAVGSPYKILSYVGLAFILPLLFAARFIILTPLSYLHEGLRRFAWERASSLTIDLSYRRPLPSSKERKAWKLQEFFTFLYGATVISLTSMGAVSYRVILLWYSVSCAIFFLNSLRTLAAHCYRNPGDRAMDVSEQYQDSVNVPGNPFVTALWAPVGLRYHATHHLFPSMPYHALGKAHRRLARDLSDGTLYLQTTRSSLWDALRTLWNDAKSAETRVRNREERALHVP